jgi:hypothetical protein
MPPSRKPSSTGDDRHTREQELLKEASGESTASSEFRSITEEHEAINEALYLLKAYYNAQSGGYLNDMSSGAS